jgi:hypothetical protein
MKATNSSTTTTLSSFSRVADMKIPDSPPPEKEEDSAIMGEQKPGMGKFEQLMKAAVSIKTA